MNLATTLAGASAPARTDVLDDPGIIAKLNPSYMAALKLSWAHVNPAYSPLISQGGAIRSALSLAVSQILSGSSPTGAMTRQIIRLSSSLNKELTPVLTIIVGTGVFHWQEMRRRLCQNK